MRRWRWHGISSAVSRAIRHSGWRRFSASAPMPVAQSAGIPIVLAWASAIAVGTMFAFVLGAVLLRLRGQAFAIATLVVTEVLRELTNGWTSMTGGGMGLNVPFSGWSP